MPKALTLRGRLAEKAVSQNRCRNGQGAWPADHPLSTSVLQRDGDLPEVTAPRQGRVGARRILELMDAIDHGADPGSVDGPDRLSQVRHRSGVIADDPQHLLDDREQGGLELVSTEKAD